MVFESMGTRRNPVASRVWKGDLLYAYSLPAPFRGMENAGINFCMVSVNISLGLIQ